MSERARSNRAGTCLIGEQKLRVGAEVVERAEQVRQPREHCARQVRGRFCSQEVQTGDTRTGRRNTTLPR